MNTTKQKLIKDISLLKMYLAYNTKSSFDQFKNDCLSAYDIYKTTQNRYNYKVLTFENWVNGQIIALQSF